MNIYLYIKKEISDLLNIQEDFATETPKFENQGDIALNVALLLSKKLGKNPVEIANDFAKKISTLEFIKSVEVAGAGFINIFLKESFLYKALYTAMEEGFGFNKNLGDGVKANIEYCSSNPTGPIHIGHTRGTIFGDVIANLLSANGYEITREFYINDAGGQIETLVKSVLIRIRQLQGEECEIPQGCYPGEYLIPIAQKCLDQFGASCTGKQIKDFVVQEMMMQIKADLSRLKVHHDVFTSEASIIAQGEVEKAIANLTKSDLIYKGVLPQPKGKQTEEWEEREQLLFKSTLFGDTEDRAIQKSDGSNTYFASDVAYHKNKLDRGFKKIIVVLGADHLGYVKRITSATKALAADKNYDISIPICQVVKFLENGNPVKMSKRKGTFTTLADVLDEVDADILRFMMLTKKNDSQMEFDIAEVLAQSKENPIFYIQYAFARGSSLVKNAKYTASPNLALLKTEGEIILIKKILEFPKVMEMAVKKLEPHLLANYCYTLASNMHSFWNMGNENHELKILTENEELTNARIFLIQCVLSVLSANFKVFGITPLSKM